MPCNSNCTSRKALTRRIDRPLVNSLEVFKNSCYKLVRAHAPCERGGGQVGRLGDRYNAWVHDPVITKEIPRFFESDFLEVQICVGFDIHS